ncbi:Outer membrane protein TolC [bioreactor metagenome]|uniref:Outer membrane protein TolC n=1 Tax=bioreactor metagenome TaxID=1076179 RepID=A0A644U7W5_9ZZZZ|nr:TolC family protein [Negativicutes bacterium]
MSRLRNKTAVITLGLMLFQNTFALAAPIQLSLQESVNLALQNNSTIKIASKDKEQSEWSVSEAKAGRMPTVSLGSNYSFRNGGENSNSLKMSLPLYTGGRTEAKIDQAKLGVVSADLDVKKAQQQLVLDTTADYYSVLETKNMLAVNQETVNNLMAHQTIVQGKYDVGVVAKSDLLRAEVEVANAQQNLIKGQNQHALAVAELLNTMNIDADTEINLAEELQYQADTRTLAEAVALAKQNRPELAKAQTAIESAAKGIEIAESGKRPSVSMSASTSWEDRLLPGNDRDWSVGVSASWNVFDAGTTKAQINQAEISRDKAELQAEQTQDAVELEVRDSYLNMREAEERLKTTDVTVAKANEDLYIARERYIAGVGTNLDVIDAQLAYTQANTNHIQALYDYNVNKAKLDKAIGL